MAESGFDGDIKLRVSLDTNALKEDLQKLKQEIDKTINSSSFSGMNEAVQKIEEAFTNLSNKIDEVGQHLEKVSATSISSDEVQKFHDELNVINETIKDVSAQTEKMGQTAAQSGQGFAQSAQEAEKIVQPINQATETIDNMGQVIEHTATTFGSLHSSISEVTSEARVLRDSIDQSFASGMFDNADARTQKIGMSLQTLYTRSEELQKKLEQLASQKAPTEAYAELQRYLEEALRTQEKVNEAMRRMEDSGIDQTSEKYSNLKRQADDLVIDIQMLVTEMEELEEAGEAFTDNFADPEGVEKLTRELGTVNDKIKLTQKGLEGTTKSTTTWSNILKNIGGLMKDILSTTGKVAKAFGGVLLGAVKKVGSAIKSAFSSAAGGVLSFGQLTKSILLAGIGVQGLMSLFRKLRSEIVSGMTEAINSVASVKASFDSVQSSIANLKAQLSMAFLPLVEIAIPYVQQLCAWFTNLINLVSQFIAALTGASTWRRVTGVTPKASGGGSGKSAEQKKAEQEKKAAEKKAKAEAKRDKQIQDAYAKADKEEARVNERNAKALERYEKAQKKAAEADKKRLSGLDILNNMTSNETEIEEPELEEFDKDAYLADLLAGIAEIEDAMADLEDTAGGAGAGTIEWVEEAIDSKITDLVDWLKEMWDKGDFTELGEKLGKQVKQWLDDIPWAKIKDTARQLGSSVATLLNGWMEVQGLAYSIGKTAAEALNTGFEFLNEFVHKFHFDSLGRYIAEKLNGLFDNIDWPLIADTFITGFKGMADAINAFIDTFHWDNVSETISNIINILTESLYTFATTVKFDELGQKIAEQIIKTIEKIDWEKAGQAVGATLQGLLDLVLTMIDYLKEHKEEVKQAFMDFWKGLTEELDFNDVASLMWELFKVALILNLPNILGTIASTFWTILKAKLLMDAGAKAVGEAIAKKMGEGVVSGAGKVALEGAGETAGKAIVEGAVTAAEVDAAAAVVGMAGVVAAAFATSYALDRKATAQRLESLHTQEIEQFGSTLEDINQKFTDASNRIMQESENIQAEYTNKTMEFADAYRGALDLQSEANRNLQEAEHNRAIAQTELANAQGQQRTELMQYGQVMDDTRVRLAEAEDQVNVTQQALENATSAFDKATEVTQKLGDTSAGAAEATVKGFREIEDSYQKTKEASASIDEASNSADNLSTSIDGAADSAKNLGEDIKLSANVVNDMLTELQSQISNANWAEIWSPVKTGFDTTWEEFKTNVNTKIQELMSEIPSMVETNLNMQTILEPINTQVSEFMNTVKTTVSTKMGEITTAVSDGITNMKVTIGSSLTGINDSFANAFNGIGQMVGNLMRNITQTISQGMSITAKAYNDGWAAMLRSTQTAVQQMLNMISRLISQLNQVPRALENTMRQMERVSQQTSKLNVGSIISKAKNFKIGGAASGAVIPPSMAEHLVKVGDNNRETEIISPLSTMKQAMSEVLASMNMSGGSGDIVVQIDGREVFRAMRSENSNYMKQNGGRSAFV